MVFGGKWTQQAAQQMNRNQWSEVSWNYFRFVYVYCFSLCFPCFGHGSRVMRLWMASNFIQARTKRDSKIIHRPVGNMCLLANDEQSSFWGPLFSDKPISNDIKLTNCELFICPVQLCERRPLSPCRPSTVSAHVSHPEPRMATIPEDWSISLQALVCV